MHLKRLIIAVIALPLLYFYITKLPAEYFLFLLITITAIAQYEFYSMYNVKGLLRYSGIAFGILTISAAYLFTHYLIALDLSRNLLTDLFSVSFFIVACIRLFSKRSPASSLHDIAAVIVAVVYIPGLLGYQIYLRERGAEWIIFLYGCVWASDSLAYYIGSGIGKRKLYEEVSPNKTIAGAAGSIAGGAIGAVILKTALIYSISLPFVKAVIIGIIIGAISIIGDLVESMFKRDAGVKDSGNILPGHGGILDKLDSLLFAGPVLYWAAIAFRLIE